MNLGPIELALIVLVALCIFGPTIVRRLRATATELKKVGSDE